MSSNSAKKKVSSVAGQHPPWWLITQFSKLNRSGPKKNNRLHQQFNTGLCMRNATGCNPSCQDRVKWHISFQDACFPFGQITTSPLHLCVPHYLCQWGTHTTQPAHHRGQKAHYSIRDQLDLTAFLDCLLPVCWFFTHRVEYRILQEDFSLEIIK